MYPHIYTHMTGLLGAVDAALARALPLRLWRCRACVFRHARLLLAACAWIATCYSVVLLILSS